MDFSTRLRLPHVNLRIDYSLAPSMLIFDFSAYPEIVQRIQAENPKILLPRKVLFGSHFVKEPFHNSNIGVRLLRFLMSPRGVSEQAMFGVRVSAGSSYWATHDLRHAVMDCFYDHEKLGWDMRGGAQVEADRIHEAAYLSPSPALHEAALRDYEMRFGFPLLPYSGIDLP